MKILAESTFKTLAGDASYERGRKYYDEGRVGPLSINKSRITAEVSGTRQYSVMLHHTAKLFEGQCNCPASDNFDFCKHCVAVALAYYYQTQTNQELSNESHENIVLNHLNTLTKPQLAQELYQLLRLDDDAMDLWQLRAEIASGGLNAKEIRKRVTKAIPYKPAGLWRYRDVADYFSSCEAALALLDPPVKSLEPVETVKIAMYAAQRLDKTLRNIDDSGGYRDHTERLIQEWYEHAYLSQEPSAQSWSQKEKVQTLVKYITDAKLDYIVPDPKPILAGLDQSTLEGLYDSLNKVFNDLTPPTDQYAEEYSFYQRIEDLLLERCQQLGDLQQEFSILEKGAVTIPKCLQLVELCIQHNKLSEANRWLAHTNEIEASSSYQVYNIESAQIQLHRAEGNHQQALSMLWSRFEEHEDAQTLIPTLELAEEIQQHGVWLKKGISYIEEKLTGDRANPKNQRRAGNLADIYLQQGDVESAYEISDRYFIHTEHLVAIINATSDFTEKTYSLIERVVNHNLRITTNSDYRSAIAFLKAQEAKLHTSSRARFYETVLSIYHQPQNKRKTKFVALLKAAFDTLFE